MFDTPYRSWLIWLTYLVLLVLAVPWYWGMLPFEGTPLWFGVPAWFCVSVIVSAATSTLTAALLWRRWPHEEDELQRKDGS